jgi:hypothetical protein
MPKLQLRDNHTTGIPNRHRPLKSGLRQLTMQNLLNQRAHQRRVLLRGTRSAVADAEAGVVEAAEVRAQLVRPRLLWMRLHRQSGRL